METFEHLYRTKSPTQFLKNAQEEGYKVIGTCPSSTGKLPEYNGDSEKLILLLGNEGSGLSQEVLTLCNFNMTIPSKFNLNPSNLDSLNVSVATGILLDRLRNNRV